MRAGAIALVVAAMLALTSSAVAHPGHGGFSQSAPTAQPKDAGGGSSGLVIAAVAVGLIGMGAALGSLKYIQTQKTRNAART